MSGRKERERRRAERQLVEMLERAEDVAMFEEIFPSDPRFASFGPNATAETLNEAIKNGEIHPDCPLCQQMLAHSGPSILARVVPETDIEG
jgi:hypothetical protein